MEHVEAILAIPEKDRWAIMPVLDAVDYTMQAVEDLLAQTVPVRVLIIDQGSSKESNDAMRLMAERHHPKVLLWSFNPALPSLSAAWNRGLDFCWELGAASVLVVNNDVRLHPITYHILESVLENSPTALFVSAVGVREAQWPPHDKYEYSLMGPTGGPDFSCFLLSRSGHAKYRFDEGFIPAYGEDIDMHRRYMLEGDGDKIFSINLPFLHYASRTINTMSPEQRASWEKRRQISRLHMLDKWGGPANEETFWSPFDKGGEYSTAGMTSPRTPDLQRDWQTGKLTPRHLSDAEKVAKHLSEHGTEYP